MGFEPMDLSLEESAPFQDAALDHSATSPLESRGENRTHVERICNPTPNRSATATSLIIFSTSSLQYPQQVAAFVSTIISLMEQGKSFFICFSETL